MAESDGTENTANTESNNGDAGQNESNNSGNTGQGTSASQGAGKDVTFSPAQIDEIQKRINLAYGRGVSEGKTQTVKTEVKTEEKSKKDDTKDSSIEQARIAALELAIANSQAEARTAKIESVAASLNAVNAQQVSMLIAPYIKTTDTGAVEVVNMEGQTRLDGQGQPMSVNEFISGFLSTNPHLVKSGGGTGAGSQGAGPDSANGTTQIKSVEDVKKMSMDDLNKAVAAGITIPGSGGQDYKIKSAGDMFKP